MLDFKPKQDCFYDAAALGEVMLRLDPGENRIRNTASFNLYEGGGEFNVIQGLSKCFGLKSAIITALADNEIGRLIERLILSDGVDNSFIKWLPFDGIGQSVRNGLNFTERGFGVRKALGISDRANTAAGQLSKADLDFDNIFGKLGVRLLHTGGIYAALSDTSLETLIACLKTARSYGTVISYDLNYRASLWQSCGGEKRAVEVAESIMPYVDILIGNDIEYPLCLGETLSKKCDRQASAEVLESVCKKYPNLKLAAAIYLTPDTDIMAGVCREDGKNYFSSDYAMGNIFDPVGMGDAFAAGFLYGVLGGEKPEKSLAYGACHSMLVSTTPGDTSCTSLKEVQTLINGNNTFVR